MAAVAALAVAVRPVWDVVGAAEVAGALLTVGVLVLVAIAAAACVLHWRTARDAPAALLANALLVLVVAITTRLVVTASYGEVVAQGDVIKTIHVVLTITACVFIVRAVRHPHIDTTLRPGRDLVLAGTACTTAVLPLTLAGGLEQGPRTVARLLVAVALVGAAVALHRRFDATVSGPHTWAAPAIGLLGIAQVVLVLGAAIDPAWRLSAWAVQLGAAAIAAIGACDDLVRSQSGQRQRLYETLVTSQVVAANADGEKALDRTRAHDLRSAVAAIQGASSVLERYAEQLDRSEKEQLRQAVSDQVGRLADLVGRDDDWFAVTDVVRSARATAGCSIDLRIAPSAEQLHVQGRPAPLAAVLTKLLDAVPASEPGTVELSVTAGTDRAHVDLRGRNMNATQWLTPGTLDLAAAEKLLAEYDADLVMDVEGGIRIALPATTRVRAP